MKRLIRPIYCGISGTQDKTGKFHYTVDHDNNTEKDVISFIEPYFYKSSIADNVYWFGYKFNGNLSQDYRDQCIQYLKDVQWGPSEYDEFDDFEYDPDKFSDVDLSKLIRRSFNSLDINAYNIDTILYSVSSTNNLVKSMISCISSILRNTDRLSFLAIKKADPSNISIDIDRCLYDKEIGRLKDPSNIVDDKYLRDLEGRIRNQDSFSLRKDIKPMSLRPYVYNFLDIAAVSKSIESAANILVVDDFKSSGTTITEIVTTAKKFNPEASIYIFTLIGNKR